MRQRRVPDALADPADQWVRPPGDPVLELLDAIDPDRREAFVLTQVAGLSYDEVALVLDCPVGTIRSPVSRARADLGTDVSAADAC